MSNPDRLITDELVTRAARGLIDDDRKTQAAKLDAAVDAGDIDADADAKARKIMGFA